MSLRINPDGSFTKTFGNFGASTWTKMSLPSSGLPGDRPEGFTTTTGSENLTGMWFCDDGGIYYIRHIGKNLVWYGEQSTTNGKPTFANVGVGIGNRGVFLMNWLDLPKGLANSKGGVISLKASGGNLVKERDNVGRFGGSRWTRSSIPATPIVNSEYNASIGRGSSAIDGTQRRESPVGNEREIGNRYCTTKEIDATKGMGEQVVLSGSLYDKIYPGEIYRDQWALNGDFRKNPDSLRLQRYRIISNLISTGSGSTQTIVEPGQGNVQNGIITLMRSGRLTVNSANISTEVTQINSEQQLKFELGASYSGFGVNVDAKVSSANRNSKNLFLAKLTQVYFSVNVDNNLKPLAPGSVPARDLVYVSKVNYGRVGYLLIESSENSESIRAALSAGYSGVSINTAVESSSSYSDMKIQSFFLGGDSRDVPTISDARSLNEWFRYVKNGSRWDAQVAPVPISYELRYLNDDQIARISSTFKYRQMECVTAKGLDIIFHNVTVSRQNIGDGLSGDGWRLWGNVRFRVVGPTSRTNRAQKVYLNITPYSVSESNKGTLEAIWGACGANPCDDRCNFSPGDSRLNGRISTVNVHPEILRDVYLEVTMEIKTLHKDDNPFSFLGFHGMSSPQTYRQSLQFLMNQYNSKDDNLPCIRKKQWGSETPRYCSTTDRVHCFTTLFSVKPTD